MFNRYYQQELAYLRELAVEFSKAHPALAPMLSGPTQDPDVERLLEGTAFMSGLLRQKIDDEFPEIVHGLMQLTFPHYLRPIPATTIVSFAPKPSLKEILKIPAGAALASLPVDGTKCVFRTCYDVEIHPTKVVGAVYAEPPGVSPSIKLTFEVSSMSLDDWRPEKLRLHLAGAYTSASDVYYTLLNLVRRITVRSVESGARLDLPPGALKPAGFSHEEGLFPYPSYSFPGYRVIQEYFILPEKFLFLDLEGLERWENRGGGARFEVIFELGQPPPTPPSIKKENFLLFASPAVNLFPHEAEPILLDHRRAEYRIMPSGSPQNHYQVYSVNRVTGIRPGTVQKREYAPFELFRPMSSASPVYYISRRNSEVTGRAEVFLSAAYPGQSEPPGKETLSIDLLCTNASLPDSLQLGDISQPTSTSPELCEFRNIRTPTAPVQPPLGTNLLWRFLSHLSLNLLSLASAENLKALLKLYIFPDSRDRAAVLANLKRVDGVSGLSAAPLNRLVSGVIMRGQEIELGLHPDYFPGRGDMYLFGSILDRFLASYASLNSFTRLRAVDALRGDAFQWPARLGDQKLT